MHNANLPVNPNPTPAKVAMLELHETALKQNITFQKRNASINLFIFDFNKL